LTLLLSKNVSGKLQPTYIGCIKKVLDFSVGGVKGQYVRQNANILEEVGFLRFWENIQPNF
jgi:hypothetical protein